MSSRVKTAVAAQELGVSSDFLKDGIRSGIFQEGVHYWNISKGKRRPTYRWDIQAINQYFNDLLRT